ncbi:MAG TPA: phytoene/squalene synthase family protein [Chloroflexia bacterium]|nr:phytoene/squalene synthase family protein [Chloroflexia bacterium]
MESNAARPYQVVRPAARTRFAVPAETHLHPPASLLVFERLAEYLTPPHNLAFASAGKLSRGSGYDVLSSRRLAEAHRPSPDKVWAYRECTEIIKHHSKSFYFSARLLPAAKRAGIMALYAFCRLTDDLVDEADAQGDPHSARLKARADLDCWSRLCDAGSNRDHPVVQAWLDTRARYGIPRQLPEELLAGIRMDLSIDRYDTWDDLWVYCYRVASTVGLMSMYITGTETMDAVPYAVQLGVALQLTNILRDVGEDARKGRCYLPDEDLHAHGLTREELLASLAPMDSRWRALMTFQIARARSLYAAATPGIALLAPDSQRCANACAIGYSGILGAIEEIGYDTFATRARLGTRARAAVAWNVWRTPIAPTSSPEKTSPIRPHGEGATVTWA